MALLNLQNVCFSVGGPRLLDNINLAIESGERICLVGRNGAGKSTLLKLIAGEIRPDEGEVRIQSGIRIARLAQEVPQDTQGTIFDVVSAALGHIGTLLAEYQRLIQTAATDFNLDLLANVQAQIEVEHGWAIEQRVTQILTRLELPANADFNALSGGMKRRVLLARALVLAPDLLLLDEPTNHLDLQAIEWLEDFLHNAPFSLLFITHDRRFLRSLATRILEIDRGQLTSWPGDYENYLRRQEERLHAEFQANALFDKKLAQEEIWIRQGIKARRTRNEGRVCALEALRRQRAERRELGGNVRIDVNAATASGKRVVEAKNIAFDYAGISIIRNFSTKILRGDRIGIIGANGSGKTTFLKLLLGQIIPTHGEIQQGTNLECAYFDQHRAQLREDWNALDNVSEGREFIEINGARKHIVGYLQDFLFTPDRARAPITALSGGERNRLLLAKLFAKPSNLLIMDEPTNDLDLETLELLEEMLQNYSGTLLVVSHDRIFLDNVVTSTLVLEGNGEVNEYIGGYSDWLRQRPKITAEEKLSKNPIKQELQNSQSSNRRKLSYKESTELKQLPEHIEALEAQISVLTNHQQDPSFYQQPNATIIATNQKITLLHAELEQAYARWQVLDALAT